MKYLAIFILLLMPSFWARCQDEAAARDAHKLNHWHRPLQVGYSPVIVIVPQGVGMGVSAVVSADRRYVRIGASPMFSSVGQVYIFNYQR